jgi:hypothetical protein
MSNNHPEKKVSNAGLGMAVGMVFGSIVGLLIGNLVIYAGGGLVLGGAIGSALDNRIKKIS